MGISYSIITDRKQYIEGKGEMCWRKRMGGRKWKDKKRVGHWNFPLPYEKQLYQGYMPVFYESVILH